MPQRIGFRSRGQGDLSSLASLDRSRSACRAVARLPKSAATRPSSLTLRASYAGHASPWSSWLAAPRVALKGEAWWARQGRPKHKFSCEIKAKRPVELRTEHERDRNEAPFAVDGVSRCQSCRANFPVELAMIHTMPGTNCENLRPFPCVFPALLCPKRRFHGGHSSGMQNIATPAMAKYVSICFRRGSVWLTICQYEPQCSWPARQVGSASQAEGCFALPLWRVGGGGGSVVSLKQDLLLLRFGQGRTGFVATRVSLRPCGFVADGDCNACEKS
jgi:hypothetical protein